MVYKIRKALPLNQVTLDSHDGTLSHNAGIQLVIELLIVISHLSTGTIKAGNLDISGDHMMQNERNTE